MSNRAGKSGTRVDEDDLGDHAEGLFDTWCREVGALATTPRKDKVGWDFHVVLPAIGGSLFDAPPRLNCSVQVKAQWLTTKQGPPIKLSNWETMISDPNPWFIFVLVYDRPKEPVRGVLVHVDERWTTRAMERLWKNAADKKADPAKLTMRLTWTDSDILPALKGDALLRTIRDRIGDARTYLQNKRSWKTDAGLGPVRHTVTARFRRGDIDFGELAKAAIGDRVDGIAFPSVEVADVRFGISIPQGPAEPAKLSFTPNPFRDKAKVTFVSVTPVREECSIEFDVFSTSSVLPLPDEYRRLRLVSPLLKLELARGPELTTTYRWELQIEGADVRLDHLASAARAMRTLVDPNSPPSTLDLFGERLTVDTKQASSLHVPAHTREMLDAAMYAGVVAQGFGLGLDRIFVRPHSLIGQLRSLRAMASLFDGSTPETSLKITTSDRELDGQRVGHVFAPGIELGDRFLLVSVGLVGIASWTMTEDGGELRVTASIRLLEKKMVEVAKYSPDDIQEQVVQPLIDRGEALLETDGLHVIRVERGHRHIED